MSCIYTAYVRNFSKLSIISDSTVIIHWQGKVYLIFPNNSLQTFFFRPAIILIPLFWMLNTSLLSVTVSPQGHSI
jgi:hypothetical protein